VDGLRALAVVAVILFHAFPSVVPGGFVGVDIFFVISGYLITQIILHDLDGGRFSAANFYARRIRRIFPALILVLLATFALGWHLLLPAELVSMCRNIVASALFSANFMLLSEVGYFDIAAHMKPLLHLWSLGIEEQFYLVWPWLLWMTPRRHLVPAIVAMIAASFALNLALVGDHASSAFYLPFTRAWELLAGALLTQIPRQTQRTKEVLAVCGLAAIIASFFAFDSQTVFPGWAAAVPVAGTCLLIAAEGSFVNRITLTHRTAVNVGLISYPLYLWHWPLLVFAEIYRFKPLTDIQRGLVIGAAFVLASLTYKLLERPIRASRKAMSLAASMAVLAIAVAVPALGYVPRLPDAIAELISLPPNGAGWRVHECMLLETDANEFFPDCADDKRPLIAIWGDSTASALIPGFRAQQHDQGFGLAQYTVSSCKPVLLPSRTKHCLERNQRILELISSVNPDVVLLHAYWDANDRTEDIEPTITALRASHVPRIVIVGPVPVWDRSLPNATAAHYWRTGSLIPERTSDFLDKPAGDERLRRIAKDLNVEYISARDVFCDRSACLARIGMSLVARDAVHLTDAGSELLVRSVLDQLRIKTQALAP
jgi:peptidoglycan/LPS O-acetylase OafA/YrhL